MRFTVVVLALVASSASAERIAVFAEQGVSQSRIDGVVEALSARGQQAFIPQAEGSLESRRAGAIKRLGGLLEDAKKDYVAGKYSRAITALKRSEKSELALLLETSAGRSVLVQLNQWLGCLSLARGKRDSAVSRFRLAVALDPQATLDSSLWPPEYVRTYDAARETSIGTGTLVIRLPKVAASAAVDGRSVKVTGATNSWTLPAGLHYVFVHTPGRSRLARLLRVKGAGVASFDPPLSTAPDDEIAHDAAQVQPQWLGTHSREIAQLNSVISAAKVAVVTGNDVIHYDGDGGRLDLAASSRPSSASPIYKRWWFWTGIAVVAGGGALLWATTSGDDAPTGPVTGVFTR